MFKMSAKRYIYIILIFLPIFAFSNNYIINGYIKNKHTNNPIKDVDVYLKNLKKGTVSDENGYFIFRLDNRIDQVYVEFSHVAFETIRWQGNSSRSINVGTKNMISENVILVKLEKFNFLNILKKINKKKKIKTNTKIKIEK